jgi:hypothetical protein
VTSNGFKWHLLKISQNILFEVASSQTSACAFGPDFLAMRKQMIAYEWRRILAGIQGESTDILININQLSQSSK